MATLPKETQEYIATVLNTPEEWVELEPPCEMTREGRCSRPAKWRGTFVHAGCYREVRLVCVPCQRQWEELMKPSWAGVQCPGCGAGRLSPDLLRWTPL